MILRTTAAGLAFLALSGLAGAQDELVAKGENVYKKCKACHAVGPDAKHKVGPHQNDLFGRVAGTIDGFKFSKAMIAAGEAGLVWTDESLAAFLGKPKSYVKKTKMSFSGLKKDEDIAAVIAYLKTFDSDGPAEDGANTYQPGS